MEYNATSDKLKQHLLSFFQKTEGENFIYHNLTHTLEVVKAANDMARHYQLNDRESFIINTAAWFHDAGYFYDYNNHEARGATLAEAFLRNEGVEESIIQQVKGCILATRLPQQPTNRLEEIVCDADLFHLGTSTFPEKNKLMRKEVSIKKNKPFTKEEWLDLTIRLFESHHYFTDYCQQLLNETKKENLIRLKKKSRKKEEKDKQLTFVNRISEHSPISFSNNLKPSPIIAEPDKNKYTTKTVRPDRGIETMFRITSNNNQRLSDMADNKAQIMITVNSIILSAIISLLLRKLEDNIHLAIPTYMLLTVSVLTIIFSILATRPNLPKGLFTEEEIANKKVNLLFFGNFYKMDLEHYAKGMQQVMNDRDFLYGTLIKDIYSQGVVLGRKYKLLRISYNIFMYGLVVSVLAFVIASAIIGK